MILLRNFLEEKGRAEGTRQEDGTSSSVGGDAGQQHREFSRETAYLARALAARNELETRPFEDLLEAYERLRRENMNLRGSLIRQDRELLILRSRGESAEVLKEVQEGLTRIQGHIMTGDRNAAAVEGAREQLRLMKEVQSLQQDLRLAQDALWKLQSEHGETLAQMQSMETEISESNSDREHLKEELESVRTLLSDAEATASQSRAECQEIASRTIQEKLNMVNQMNAMNEEVIYLRGQLELRTGSRDGMKPTTIVATPSPHQKPAALSSANAVPSRCVLKLREHTTGINAVRWMDGLLGTAADDGSVHIWEAATGVQRGSMSFASNPPSSALCLAMMGSMVAAGGSDGHVHVWSVKTGRKVAHLSGHHQRVSCVDFVEVDKRIASGSYDCCIKVWDIENQWNVAPRAMRAKSKCECLAVGPGGVEIITGHMDGALRFWDLRTSSPIQTLSSLHEGHLTSVTTVQDKILTCGLDSKLNCLDTRMYQRISCMSHDTFRVANGCRGACLSTPNSRYACAGSADNLVYIFETEGGRLVAQLESHSAPVLNCDWKGSSLSTCDKAGCVAIWK